MSTIKSSDEHLTLNADGTSKDIKFQANGVEKASISSAGAFTSTTIDATKLTGTIPNFTSTGIDDNATSTAITIDSNENVGFGVTPETDWYPKVIQSGNRGAVYGYSNQTHLSNNAKMIDVSENYKYMESSYATDYSQEGGTHQFKVASSGSADSAITWTTALNITNDGRGLSQFTAKAWCNFNGTGTAAINDSHNVSSLTDSGTGQFWVNFSNAMANANYAVSGMTQDGYYGAVMYFADSSTANLETGRVKVATAKNGNAGYVDRSENTLIVFGD